jgi:hypothetical protein
MLRRTPFTPITIVLTTLLMVGLASALPLRQYAGWMSRHAIGPHAPPVQYLTDWLTHPGLAMLLGIILLSAIVMVCLMLYAPGEPIPTVRNYLLLQGAVVGLATLGLLALMNAGFPSHNSRYLSGFTSLWILGLWTSAVSGLWASGRLKPWLG